MATLLSKIYSNPRNSSSFSSVEKLYDAARKKRKNIKRKEVEDFLASQDSYTLFRNRRVNYPTAKTHAISTDQMWQLDLSTLIHLAEENDNIKYLFVCIDVFSRYLWIRPLESKSSEESAKAIVSIFKEGRIPGFIVSDSGTEFKGKFQEVLKAHNVGYFTLHSPSKASIAERIQRTIKTRIFRYLNHNNTKRYIDVLQHIVYAYNSAIHRTIGTTPIKKSSSNQYEILKFSNNKKIKYRYSPGDFVIVSRAPSTFKKSFEGTFNSEIFIVHKLMLRSNIKVYQLRDLNDKVIEGIFYEEEIQKVNFDPDDEFKIEKIIHKRKIKGKYHYKVRWVGYPSSFDSYIPVDSIKITS